MTDEGISAASGATDDRAALARWVAERMHCEPGALEPIAPGLGHRSFLRISLPESGPDVPRSVILRVDPPHARVPVAGVPPEPPLEPIRTHLEAAGLPVPKSFGHDAERGLDLLEDVGDLTLEIAAQSVGDEARRALYREAIDLVARLQQVGPAAAGPAAPAAFERRLDRALIETKARKLIEWLLPEALGREASVAERGVIDAAFAWIADLALAAPARLAHRDYKAANIHVRPDASLEPGAAGDRLVLIDLQGAFMAPPEYDLVCLLRDSHVPIEPAEVDAQLAYALDRLPDAPDPDMAGLRFDAMTISRVGKDLAHYLDAARSRGDDRYLGFVELGLDRLRSAALGLSAREARWSELADLILELETPVRCLRGANGDASSCAR